METSYILPRIPSGHGRKIFLSGIDLIFTSIKNVFVYPFLDVHRLKEAISETLSFWPILTGRMFVHQDEYGIECSDLAIPFTYMENEELDRWPNMHVLVDDTVNLEPYIDYVRYQPLDEPLLRLKVTKLLRSGEYIFGTSFSHVVGDGASNFHFIRDLSRVYQNLSPDPPYPTFDRYLSKGEELDCNILSALKPLQNALKQDVASGKRTHDHLRTELVTLQFTSEQLATLHTLGTSNDKNITIHDVLNAYIISTLNIHCILEPKEYFKNVTIVVDIRGVSDQLVPLAHVANSFITVTSPDFVDPLSLLDIAKTIRKTIEACRQIDFIRKWLSVASGLMKQIVKDGRVPYSSQTNEIVINSNFKFDWASAADLGMHNQCRFHTATSFESYFRIFRSNPFHDTDGHWRRNDGAVEVAFRVRKNGMKEKLLLVFQKDRESNFKMSKNNLSRQQK